MAAFLGPLRALADQLGPAREWPAPNRSNCIRFFSVLGLRKTDKRVDFTRIGKYQEQSPSGLHFFCQHRLKKCLHVLYNLVDTFFLQRLTSIGITLAVARLRMFLCCNRRPSPSGSKPFKKAPRPSAIKTSGELLASRHHVLDVVHT